MMISSSGKRYYSWAVYVQNDLKNCEIMNNQAQEVFKEVINNLRLPTSKYFILSGVFLERLRFTPELYFEAEIYFHHQRANRTANII